MNRIGHATVFGVTMIALACGRIAADALANEPVNVNATPTSKPTGDFRAFTLTAVAPPMPALKYRFDIDPVDRIKGNSAALYLQALIMHTDAAQHEDLAAIEGIESDDAFAKAAAEKVPWLDTSMPSMLVDAARRTECDWDVPLREHGIEALLPYLTEIHDVANYVGAEVRLATSQGDAETALELLRQMIILADRTDDGENTPAVSNLVSIGSYTRALDRLQHVMSLPKSPNLYWAIRSLPTEFGNQRAAAQAERETIFYMFPILQRARAEELTGEEWRAVLAQVRTRITDYRKRYPNAEPTSQPDGRPDPSIERVLNATIFNAIETKALLVARAHYAETRHLEAPVVDQIDSAKLIGVWYFDTYSDFADQLITSFSLPYPQRITKVKRLRDEFRHLRELQPANPLFVFGSTYDRFVVTNARADRMTAAFGAVEAVRSYAAANGGKLPPTLSAIGDETPAPDNPITGKPFAYVVSGDVATISDDGSTIGHARRSEDGDVEVYPLRYEVRIRK